MMSSLLALSQEHQQHLLEELGTEGPGLAAYYGARTINAEEAWEQGFRFAQQRTGGLLLPFEGDFAQLRCDDPPTTCRGERIKYLNRKGVKQTAATFGEGEPVIATEGWKDALRLHIATGETTQAIAGVTAWKLLAPSVQLLIYDADAVTNPSVWGQLIAAGLERPRLRLAFFPRDLAGDKGGACEFFQADGNLPDVARWKARELLRELPQRWDKRLRVDWHAPAVRKLAAQALQAGFSRDALAQLVDQAAKQIGLPLPRARQILNEEKSNWSTVPVVEGEQFIPRNDAPPERQAAEALYAEHEKLVASRGGKLLRYDQDAGYWRVWPMEEVKAAALGVLKRMCKAPSDRNGDRPRFCYGTDQQVNSAASLLVRTAGPGPLRDTLQCVIVFGNGTFNPRTRQFEPHSSEHGATYAVDADYLPNAECPAELQRVIETCYPEGAEAIIRAEYRWLVDPTVRYGEVFHHLGDTGTGKGLLIEHLAGLLPPSLQSSLAHPADIESPDKLHQYVQGRRVILFPDAPARPRNQDHCGVFYELVENKPQVSRRLYSSDAERTAPMNVRCIIGSVAPLHFRDGRDGFLRRCLTLRTLPRSGDPDPTLRGGLVGTTYQHRLVRSLAASWALSMPDDELEAVLNKDDPEGLLRLGDAEATAAGDTVSQFVDACLVPHPFGPDAEVDAFNLAQVFQAYRGWCRYAGVEHGMQLTNFQGQLRRVLGPKRCLPRWKESRTAARADGRSQSQRQNLPSLDAGFALRPGLLGRNDSSNTPGDKDTFDRLKIGSGGLETIGALAPAQRPGHMRPPSEGPGTPHRPDSSDAADPAGGAESPGTTPPVPGPTQGTDSGIVSGQSHRTKSQTSAGFSGNQGGWSQGSSLKASVPSRRFVSKVAGASPGSSRRLPSS